MNWNGKCVFYIGTCQRTGVSVIKINKYKTKIKKQPKKVPIDTQHMRVNSGVDCICERIWCTSRHMRGHESKNGCEYH